MSFRRTLVDCAVLSLQDTCVFYPCCKGCFSRINVEQQDTTRCRCSKCGFSCLREQVDYRYRLSLKVARDRCLFGVTVFGTCLNTFFGIHASGLQRLVESSEGATTRSTLLVKAVEDCFIGRHFIFGIKVAETQSEPWLGGGPVANGSSSKEAVHFIASQMLLPKPAGLAGCTVVSFYRLLLQKAAEYEQASTDPSKTSRPPAPTLLRIPCRYPASSFSNATLSASGLLSQSQSSQCQDGTLTPTPPWQQSLGLVTSSAEQEEGCSTQDSTDDNSRQTDNDKTPQHAQRGCLENHKVTEESAMSRLSSECSPPFAKYPYSSIGKAVGNTPILNTWLTPPPPGLNSSKGFSSRQLTNTFLSSSIAWEDLPFSESLAEFLCEENKDFDVISESEPHLNVQNQKETTKNKLEITSHVKNVSHGSASVCTQITDGHSLISLDINTNTTAPNGGDRQDLSHPVGCANKSQDRNICSNEWNQEEEEEQLEEDTYNCSADLFSSSLVIDMSTNKLNTHVETVRTTAAASPLLSSPSKRHLRSEKATQATPDKHKRKSKRCTNRDSLNPTQDIDFIPPSQSTPIVKVAVGSHAYSYRTLTSAEFSQDSCAFYRNQPELDSKKTPSSTASLCKPNCVSANVLPQCARESAKENLVWSATSSRHGHIFTPKRRFWKPDEHKKHPSVQRGALNTRRISHKSDSSVVTVCDFEDSEVIVPPTPAAETQPSVELRGRKRQTDGSSTLGFSWEGQQGDGVNCKRTITSSQTGNCDSEAVVQGSLNGSDCCLLDDEACDWSRDLFSDSI